MNQEQKDVSSNCPYLVLHNGVKMPQVGAGLWRAADNEETVNIVRWAAKCGYRLFDTAEFYQNEISTGKGIKDCGIPREELFITTKVWNNHHGYEQTINAFEQSLANLDVDYIDLYLIHWPGPDRELRKQTWRALEKLYEDKKVRAIGVSNFNIHHLEELLHDCKVCPMVNQVELHPHFQQEELRAYCEEKNIVVTAWRPLGKGEMLQDENLLKIAEKHKRSPAQVIIRWMVQLGIVTIPKSSHEERLRENFNVFDFKLDDNDMQIIKSMNKNVRMGGDPDKTFPM